MGSADRVRALAKAPGWFSVHPATCLRLILYRKGQVTDIEPTQPHSGPDWALNAILVLGFSSVCCKVTLNERGLRSKDLGLGCASRGQCLWQKGRKPSPST